MDNPEALNIEYTSHMRKKRKRKPRGQSRMDNPETLSTLNTQDRGQIMLKKTEGIIKNGQSRGTVNIEYTRHRTNKH